MMNKNKLLFLTAIITLLFVLCACAGGNGQIEPSAPTTNPPTQNESTTASPDTPPTTAQQSDLPTDNQSNTTEPDTPIPISGEVIISFDYERISGSASNQWAVWIEDMSGNLIRTLYATAWTADGGYTMRPDSIALWIEKSGRASMTDAEVDAVSGATPRAGTQSYTWDLTDANGNTVDLGEYRFVVEGTLRWKNYVLYSGTIMISDAPMTVQADADFIYEASDRYAALTSDSLENAMIGAVTANFSPTAYSSVILEIPFEKYGDMTEILNSPFAECIAQGYVIETAMRSIALVHPDFGWNEEDADSFSAKVDDDGWITVTGDSENVFRVLEGMTTGEMHEVIRIILISAGMD